MNSTASLATAPSAADSAAGLQLIAAIRAELPDLRLLTDTTDRESYRADETPYLVTGLPLAVVLPESTAEVSGLMRLAHRFRVPGRAAWGGHGTLGRRRRSRRGAHDRVHAHEQGARDRSREPRRGRPARDHQRRPQARRRQARAVLSAGSRLVRDVLDRREPRHQRGRPVLREVRADARLGARARSRPRRRHGDPDRRPERQGRRGLLADAPVRRARRGRWG